MTHQQYRQITSYINNVISCTKWENHMYVVGGCLRDMLLDQEINDIDLAVNLPDGGVEFALWLHENSLTVKAPVIFHKFGTAKVRLKEFPQHEIELVQTRAEKYTQRNSRNPETAFGTLTEDCLRRDLTINSLYYDISNRQLLDLSEMGIDDIRNKIIRTPSEPNSVFDDDPVRILRCIRFSAKLNWPIETLTWEGLKRNVSRLTVVTPERAFSELDKIVTGPNPTQGLRLLAESGALAIILPELEATRLIDQNKYHFGTVWEHTLKVVDNVAPVSELRWGALLHDIGKINTRSIDEKGVVHFYRHERCAKTIKTILGRLRARPEFVKIVAMLAECHNATKSFGDNPSEKNLPDIRKMQRRIGSAKRLKMLLALIHADNISHAPEYGRPNQVKIIKSLIKKDVKSGFDIYRYQLPIPLRRIMKLLRVKNPDNVKVKEFYNRLMLEAYINPQISRQSCEALINRWTNPSR